MKTLYVQQISRTRLEVEAGGNLDEEMDEPGSDTCPHNVDEEVANGEEPCEGVLQALLCQGLHDAWRVLGSSYTHTGTDGFNHNMTVFDCLCLHGHTACAQTNLNRVHPFARMLMGFSVSSRALHYTYPHNGMSKVCIHHTRKVEIVKQELQ